MAHARAQMVDDVSSSSLGLEIKYGPERRPWRETLPQLAKAVDGDEELLVSPPSMDPLKLHDYGNIERVTSSLYQLPATGLSREHVAKAHSETAERVQQATRRLLGYQCRFHYGHAKCCERFPYLNTHINNCGDPFTPSRAFSTNWMERNVLDYFASLWNAKWPHDPRDPESYWGYTLTMGSTEGNLCALWNARDYLSGKKMRDYSESEAKLDRSLFHSYQCVQSECPADNPNALTPVVLYSEETHYSIPKALQVVSLPTTLREFGTKLYPGECPLETTDGEWPHAVPCVGGGGGSGAIDIQALTTLVDFFTSRGHPIMVIFNYGTTFKGAYDDVEEAGKALLPVLEKNGMYERRLLMRGPDGKQTYIDRKGFWFHVDGAFGASYAPFLQMAYRSGLTDVKPPPRFDFKLGFVSSVVTSGHKWIGVPWPCGVFITKSGLTLHQSNESRVSYTYSPDTTVAGSRNGHSALILWNYFSTHSYQDQVELAVKAAETALYVARKLREVEDAIGQDLWVIHAPASLAVCFKQPSPEVREKFTLPCSWLCVEGEWRLYAHLFVVEGTTAMAMIDEMIESLKKPGAFV